jgi:hypothetical protein
MMIDQGDVIVRIVVAWVTWPMLILLWILHGNRLLNGSDCVLKVSISNAKLCRGFERASKEKPAVKAGSSNLTMPASLA